MMTSLLTPKRYMVTIALRMPGCHQPSRHRWHVSRPSWVGLRTERGREGEGNIGREGEREREREKQGKLKDEGRERGGGGMGTKWWRGSSYLLVSELK